MSSYLSVLDLVLLDIKSSNPDTYKVVTGRDLAPTLRFAERLAKMNKPVWVRFTLVPGHTDDPANVEGIAKFVATDEERRVGRGSAVPQDGRVQVEGDELEYRHIKHPATDV
jgi:pyruvate formate lyase activating enzyme